MQEKKKGFPNELWFSSQEYQSEYLVCKLDTMNLQLVVLVTETKAAADNQ